MDKLNLSLDEIIKKSKEENRNKKNNERINYKNNVGNKRRNNFNSHKYNNNQGNNITNKVDKIKWDDQNYNNKRYNNRRNYDFHNQREFNQDCRLKVSNLHYNVMNDELYTIFSSMGQVKRCGIHWDKAGISKGTADVEYENYNDAKKAMDYLNGAEFEGQNIKLEYNN